MSSDANHYTMEAHRKHIHVDDIAKYEGEIHTQKKGRRLLILNLKQ